MKTNELINFKIEGTADTTATDTSIRVYFNKIPVNNATLLIAPTRSFEINFKQLCDFKKNTISVLYGAQSYFHIRSIMFNNLKIDRFDEGLIDCTVSSSNNAYTFTFQSPYAYHILDRL